LFEKVVIEVQKSPFIPEINRFRNYVAEKYAKVSTYKVNESQVEEHLPIKTIYLLDKKFSDTLPAVLHRKGEYYDVLYQRKYEGEKNKYVELLSHDSWFIQIEKLPPDLKNDLAIILSVFAPWLRDPEQEFYINVEEEMLSKKHALLQKILRRLENATHNKNLLLTLDTERKIEDEIDKYQKQIEEAQKKEKEALAKEKEERRQKEQALAKEQEALAKERETRILSARTMLQFNIPIENIIQATGLSREEIEKLK